MYIETHEIPSNKNEYIITLFTDADTKVKATVVIGLNEALKVTREWSKENGGCEYNVNGPAKMRYGKHGS